MAAVALTVARRSARVRRSGRAADRCRARAFVVFAILIVLFVGALYVILTGLNTATASMKLSRDEANAAVLKAAKEGLIAWAATRAADGPGHLPCPDRHLINDPVFTGYQSTGCVGPVTRLGRLPFRTLGLPDLRDASGERLWYAVSPDFRDGVTPIPLAVNSDTQGALTVEGMNAASGVVAIIFAPGTVVGAQVRDPASSTNPDNYLEGKNPYLADVFLAWSGCEASACALPFSGGAAVARPHNDQLILVTHEDLFRVVEAVVQRRIELEIVPRLTNPVPGGTAAVAACQAAESAVPGSYAFPAGYLPGYFEEWASDQFGKCNWLRGFFPFAAPYDDPAGSPTDPSRPQAQYVGRVPQIAGLLPVSTAFTWVTDVAKTNPVGPGTLTPPPLGCAPICTFTYTCDPFTCGSLPVTATVRLRNAAGSLVRPTGIASSSDWLVVHVATASNPALTFGKAFDVGTGDLVFSIAMTLPSSATPTDVEITLPTPTFNWIANPNWFTSNGWYRQTYYTVSDGFRLRTDLNTRQIDPAGAGYAPCQPESDPPTSPAEACVRVRNGPATARAVLVLAGRHLPGGPRGYTIGQYFELQNADVPGGTGAPPNLLFERGLRSTDFNDRVVVVASEPTP